MAKILIIDDDEGILKLVERVLLKEGHSIITKSNPKCLDASDLESIDLLILDVMMPEIDGFTFCKEIRNKIDCPILFLTAKTDEEDIVEGLALGADDYIKKPFGISELRARVEAHLRREKREKLNYLVLGDVSFHLLEKSVIIGDEKLPLTKGDYEICELLARHRGQVFSLEQILEEVFGYDSDSDITSIRVHIKNIRKKFTLHLECPIETIWGVGYIWR